MKGAPSSLPVLSVILALFLAAGLLRINDLMVYTPDSARYMIWGNSIASGRGFVDDTQPEDLRFVIHAPLYSVLIAPVEFFFPLSVRAVKIATLFWGAAALLLLWGWLRAQFGKWPSLAGVLMLACNPLFLIYATEPLSEVPFIVVLLTLFVCVLAAGERGEVGRGTWPLLVFAAAVIGLLREIGVVVWLCLVAWFFLRDRRKAAVLFLSGAVALGAWYVRNTVLVGPPPGAPAGNVGLLFQHFLTGPGEPVLMEFLQRLWLNLGGYAEDILGMLFFPLYGPQHVALIESPLLFPRAVRWITVVVFGGIIARGCWKAGVSGPAGRFTLAVAAVYIIAAALYPVHDVRFILPLLPVMIFLVISGLRGAAGAVRTPVVLGTAVLVLLPNLYPLAELLRLNRAYLESPVGLHARLTENDEYPFYYTQPWTLLGEWIGDHLSPGDVLATPTKELALVSGGGKVMELDPGLTQTLFERLIRTNGVSWLLAPVRWRDMKVYEFLMNESRRLAFTEVFSVANLHLMRIGPARPPEEATGIPEEPAPAVPDRSDAASLLRQARREIKRGDYDAALRMLTEASEQAPSYPEIRFQTVVAHAMAGDSAGAAGEFEKLMGYPQVASYIFPARYHLFLVEAERAARRTDSEPDRRMRILDVSRRYWDNGYSLRARDMLTAEMKDDTAYFVGHMWAFHFNFQTGDTGMAAHFLARLDAIDSTNNLVRNFHELTALRGQVRALPPSGERAGVRLSMAGIYRDIELFDEACDEGEAAVSDDPEGIDARRFLADLYERQGYAGRALGLYRDLRISAGDLPGLTAKIDSLTTVVARSRR